MASTSLQIETAARLFANGNMKEADAICQQILEQQANHTNALHLRGVIAYQMQNYKASTHFLNLANSLANNNPDIMFALAASHENTGQYAAAIKLYNKICALTPNNITAWQQLAGVLEKNHQYTEAIAAYLNLNKLEKNNPNVLLALARLHIKLNAKDKAVIYLQSLKKNADTVNDSGLWNNIGLIEKALNQPKDAIVSFEQALKIDDTDSSNHEKARLNLASTLQDIGDFNSAKRYYLDVIRRGNSKSAEISRAQYNLSLIYLGEGEFSTAWKHLYKRPKIFSDTPKTTDLKNKTLLVHGEEGMGDELIFLRFIPLLVKQGAQVEYIGNPKLVPILKQLTYINRVHTNRPATTKFDYCIAAMDLPYILDINDVSTVPPVKLLVDNSLSHEILNRISRLASQTKTIGITWRAGTSEELPSLTGKNAKYLRKEIPLSALCDALAKFTGNLVVLQRNPREEEIDYLHKTCQANIIDASSLNNDLNLMLRLLSKINRYIGVSNTNMHLYGSLEKYGEVIVPFPGEWRWTRKKHNSPWYKGFTLHHQTSDNDWQHVIDQIKNTI